MEQFKRAKVIMLPTKVKSNLQLNRDGLRLSPITFIGENHQHLYITSDDEIKEGDWKLDTFHKQISRVTNLNTISKYDKKIIATTDTSLMTTVSVPHIGGQPNRKMLDVIKLPQPSQQFIEKYIEEYNKGNIITDVLVEYEHFDELGNYIDNNYHFKGDIWKLKIKSKDNTITIKKLKNNWDEKELDFEFNKLLGDLLINKRNKDLINNPNSNKISEYVTNWIKENL